VWKRDERFLSAILGGERLDLFSASDIFFHVIGFKELRRLALVTVFAVFASCATHKRVVNLDTLEFVATKTPSGYKVDCLDPRILFDEATKDYEEGLFFEAIRKFSLILERFKDDPLADFALYNRGICYAKAERPLLAKQDFEEFLKKHKDDPDAIDASLWLGHVMCDLGEWEGAEKALRRALEKKDLSLPMEIEARAYLAQTLKKQGRYTSVRKQVDMVFRLFSMNISQPEISQNYYVAMACFIGASVWHDMFSRVRFYLPVERMEKDLQDKASFFLKAQSEYLRTIRVGNTYWGVKAGMALGRLFEEFYEHIMQAEVPSDLTGEDLDVYLKELKKMTRPLLLQAMRVYERNVAMARLNGAKEEWLDEAQQRIERINTILKEEASEQEGGRE
jgi:tetratricopeptide (TPR) repeat protein